MTRQRHYRVEDAPVFQEMTVRLMGTSPMFLWYPHETAPTVPCGCCSFQPSIPVLADGGYGLNKLAIRHAVVTGCLPKGTTRRTVKLALYVHADGLSIDGHTELIRFQEGEFERLPLGTRDKENPVAWALACRHWVADVRLQYDAGLLSADDVVKCLGLAGMAQMGMGRAFPECRPCGTFDVVLLNNVAPE